MHVENELLANLDKVHTTQGGIERMSRNMNLPKDEVVGWCKERILRADSLIRKGKNWYVGHGDVMITVNASSYTIITAHEKKTSV